MPTVPDRANDSRRNLSLDEQREQWNKMQDELAEKYPPSSLTLGTPLNSTKGKGYTKKQAMKRHKDQFESGE
jgi:hypothetical protein